MTPISLQYGGEMAAEQTELSLGILIRASASGAPNEMVVIALVKNQRKNRWFKNSIDHNKQF